MKKLNFKNQVAQDDKKLVSLLKTSIKREPSGQFVENTLEKLLILKTKQRIIHKPLKSPLYLILVIGLILPAPIFLTVRSETSLPNIGFELENFVENTSFQLDPWYTLSLILLALVSMAVVWVELGLVRFRNPFA